MLHHTVKETVLVLTFSTLHIPNRYINGFHFFSTVLYLSIKSELKWNDNNKMNERFWSIWKFNKRSMLRVQVKLSRYFRCKKSKRKLFENTMPKKILHLFSFLCSNAKKCVRARNQNEWKWSSLFSRNQKKKILTTNKIRGE